jgi:peptidoglycan/LPS O-acetylase OafA/YrhL
MRAPARLHSLDAARGFAALAVVVFHWQFWGRDPDRIAPLGGFAFPRALGETVLAFFYQCGASAVGFFFTLSGFVFYWLYREAVQERRVDGRRFCVDRFSRLYPLYLATLIWAWAGHNFYAWMLQGPTWDSGVNNFTGFLRQLFVFPLWAPTRMIGFNLPAWSLAVEALLYVLFFFMARRAALGIAGTLAMLVVGRLANLYSNDIGYGITSFFMGGLAWIAFDRLRDARWERALGLFVGGSWLLAFVFGSGVVKLALTPLAFLDQIYAMYVLFPTTVLYLALRESHRGPTARGLEWFGDASYGIYLLHFPLMLTTSIALRAAASRFEAIKSPWALAAFAILVVLLAVLSHRCFERPAQDWIRRRFGGGRREPVRSDGVPLPERG